MTATAQQNPTARLVTCKYCRRVRANAGRGLCRGCHTDPAVRALYQPLPHPPLAASLHRPRCRHCGLRVGSRPYQLCEPCFAAHGTVYREMYGRSCPQGSATGAPAGLPPHPTRSGPGGVVRLLVMRARLQHHQHHTHPNDAREMASWDVGCCECPLDQLLRPGKLAKLQHGKGR